MCIRSRDVRRTAGAKGKAAAFASHLWIGISNNVSRGGGTINSGLDNLNCGPIALDSRKRGVYSPHGSGSPCSFHAAQCHAMSGKLGLNNL